MIGVTDFASSTEGRWERVDDDDNTVELIMARQVEDLLRDD